MARNSHLSAREYSLPSFIYRYSCEFNELIMSNGVILCWEEKQKEILDDGKKKTQCRKAWELDGE